jgi:hypothetical protein
MRGQRARRPANVSALLAAWTSLGAEAVALGAAAVEWGVVFVAVVDAVVDVARDAVVWDLVTDGCPPIRWSALLPRRLRELQLQLLVDVGYQVKGLHQCQCQCPSQCQHQQHVLQLSVDEARSHVEERLCRLHLVDGAQL